MSRARNRADGDFGDLDITNIGAVSLDSIKGDADGNTSLAFTGSDVITITTGGTTAMTIDASQNTTLAGTLTAVTSITVGSAALTEAELELLDGITAGTAAASKVLVLDSNKDIGTIRNLTIDGTFSDGNYTFDTSGNVSGLGTVASGNITSSGTVQGTTITATTAFVPDASDGAALGTTSLEFSDLFLADGAVISLGDDQDVTLTHVADTGILLNGTSQLQFNDASQNITAPSATVLDINATDEIELNATLVDINANVEISGNLALAGNLEVTGTSSQTVTATGAVVPDASDGASLGTSSLEFSDLFLADGAVISLGDDDDVTLTHVHNEGILFNSTNQFRFGDSGTYIHQSADGVLDLVSDNEIELNGTLVDINANVEISGTTAQVGVATFTARDIHSGGITIANDGQIGSVGDADAIAISSAGVTTFSQKDVHSIGMSVKNGATSAGFVEFFEDSDNGSNKVTLIGPASTADVTVVLPSAAGTVATTDDATALAIALG